MLRGPVGMCFLPSSQGIVKSKEVLECCRRWAQKSIHVVVVVIKGIGLVVSKTK